MSQPKAPVIDPFPHQTLSNQDYEEEWNDEDLFDESDPFAGIGNRELGDDRLPDEIDYEPAIALFRRTLELRNAAKRSALELCEVLEAEIKSANELLESFATTVLIPLTDLLPTLETAPPSPEPLDPPRRLARRHLMQAAAAINVSDWDAGWNDALDGSLHAIDEFCACWANLLGALKDLKRCEAEMDEVDDTGHALGGGTSTSLPTTPGTFEHSSAPSTSPPHSQPPAPHTVPDLPVPVTAGVTNTPPPPVPVRADPPASSTSSSPLDASSSPTAARAPPPDLTGGRSESDPASTPPGPPSEDDEGPRTESFAAPPGATSMPMHATPPSPSWSRFLRPVGSSPPSDPLDHLAPPSPSPPSSIGDLDSQMCGGVPWGDTGTVGQGQGQSDSGLGEQEEEHDSGDSVEGAAADEVGNMEHNDGNGDGHVQGPGEEAGAVRGKVVVGSAQGDEAKGSNGNN